MKIDKNGSLDFHLESRTCEKLFLEKHEYSSNNNYYRHYWTKLTPVISEGTFWPLRQERGPKGAGPQGGSAPLLGSWDTT